MSLLKELKSLVDIETIEKITYNNSLKLDKNATFNLLDQVKNHEDLSGNLVFYGDGFKIVTGRESEYDELEFIYISLNTPEGLPLVTPTSLTKSWWSKELNASAPFKDKAYLEEEKRKEKQRIAYAIERVGRRIKNLHEAIEDIASFHDVVPGGLCEPFKVYENTNMCFYITLPPYVRFENSYGFIGNSHILSQLDEDAIRTITWTGYSGVDKNLHYRRPLSGMNLEKELEAIDGFKNHPSEAKELEKQLYREYASTIERFTSDGELKLLPTVGIAPRQLYGRYEEMSTRKAADEIATLLKELFEHKVDADEKLI